MTTRSTRHSRFRTMAACIALGLAMSAGAQEAPPQIIDQGEGWQLIAIPSAAQGLGTLDAEPAPILVVESQAGLEQSPLPESIKAELAPEFAAGGDTVSLAVHYDLANAIAEGTAQDEFGQYIEPDAEGLATAKIGCDTGWRDRTKSFTRDFDGYRFERDYTNGGFTGDLKIDVPLSGEATLDVNWAFKKTSFCLPWTAKFVSARARGTLDVGETLIEATGTARYAAAERRELLAPEIKETIMVGPIPLVVGAEFPVGVGYGVEATGTANVAIKSRAQGRMVIDMTCTKEDCAPTEGGDNTSTVTFDDLINPNLQASVSVQADVKPYAYVEARGFLYHQDIASAGFGAELSVPTRFFYYVGNGCGNGTGSGAGDLVNGGYFNVAAQIELYRNATVFWDDSFDWIDWPMAVPGNFFREAQVTQFLRDGGQHTALRGELFFTTFGGSVNPLTPILAGPATVNLGATQGYTVSKRSCVPMDAPLNYTIAWGDGANNSPLQAAPGSSASATHTFNSFGTQTVTAKLVNDQAGRSINRSTSRTITVNANAEPPMPASMTVPASDADGSFTIGWTAAVNTTAYKIFRRVNTGSGFGAWSEIHTGVTGTSKSLTAQPYGTVQYGVRACNNMGCSDTRTSASLLVGTIPAAPVLSVVSQQCYGFNDVSWTAPSGANRYELYWSAGTDPNNAAEIYDGAATHQTVNVPGTTRLWVKACGTAGCSAFSAMKTAQRNPICE